MHVPTMYLRVIPRIRVRTRRRARDDHRSLRLRDRRPLNLSAISRDVLSLVPREPLGTYRAFVRLEEIKPLLDSGVPR